MKLINEYENSIREVIFLFNRFSRLFQLDLQQSSSKQRFVVIISSKKMSSIFNLKQFFASSSLSIDLKQFFSVKFIRKFITDVTIKTSIDASSIVLISRKTNSVQKFAASIEKKISIDKSRQKFAVVISIRKSYIDANQSFEKKHEAKN